MTNDAAMMDPVPPEREDGEAYPRVNVMELLVKIGTTLGRLELRMSDGPWLTRSPQPNLERLDACRHLAVEMACDTNHLLAEIDARIKSWLQVDQIEWDTTDDDYGRGRDDEDDC